MTSDAQVALPQSVPTFVELPERHGWQGLMDKLASFSVRADKHSKDDPWLIALARSKMAPAGNAADAKFRAWEKFCEKLPYGREAGERVPSMEDIATEGGDCDDLTILACAGLRSQDIPCVMQILTDADGNGYHIRCLVGLPPVNPDTWIVFDPAAKSEAEWAMANRIDLAPRYDGAPTVVAQCGPEEWPVSLVESPPAWQRTHPVVWVLVGAGILWLGGKVLQWLRG